MKKRLVIKADILLDGRTRAEKRWVVVEGERIAEVSRRPLKADIEGVVTPAFIDAHSHIAMQRAGEPGEEINDQLGQLQPCCDPLNSLYMDDQALREAVDFGVLYSCIVPGSGNLIGGKARIIRNFAGNVADALFRDYGYKMALGYNPRSTTAWKGDRPTTRMGLLAMLENYFDGILDKHRKAMLEYARKDAEVVRKEAKKELDAAGAGFERDCMKIALDTALSTEEKEVLELLSGRKTCKIHAHKEDDLVCLMRLAEKYRLKVTADHTCDVFRQGIYEDLAARGIPVVYGPLGGVAWKTELKHASYENVRLLMRSGVSFGLMTDHPVRHAMQLRDCLQYFLIQGMSEADAIGLVTRSNAEILGIDDELGTVEPGKLASLVVWDRHPLWLGAFPRLVLGEGRELRKR
jgi:imidazolonepropionase-like amidohydrolase